MFIFTIDLNKVFLCTLLLFIISCNPGQQAIYNKSRTTMITPFEKNENQTPTYYEVIDFYKELAQNDRHISIRAAGPTDAGEPLHEVVVTYDGESNPLVIRERGDLVLFINNAIHPGEPCGVDASMMWIRDIAKNADQLKGIAVVMIPFYNIGGGLNRSSHSRANQVGPEAYGFRGNARNLDLNRDFIKCDSKNARSFNQLFNRWNPEVMIDNHTSNGADYQYVMTLIATQKDKLQPELSALMTQDMLPFLYKEMEAKNWEMIPYVYARETPDEGIAGFLDYARYSSGYAALHHTISFMPETHMLKPYKDRVWSTYAFMQTMLDYLQESKANVLEAKSKAVKGYAAAEQIAINWKMDLSRVDSIEFKGYEAAYKPSKVSGLSRLYYDRNKPKLMTIPFYNSYLPSNEVSKPKYYVFPQAYDDVAERLIWNGVKLDRADKNETLEVEAYYIDDYEDIPAYEGHYLHYNTVTHKEVLKINIREGDYIVRLGQDADRFIMETLEPEAPDSYFSWNFFDGILMQKEYFSPYVFEDLASQLLDSDPELKMKLDQKRQDDDKFREDANAQLRFIYENSPFYEKTHRRYPVYRVM